MRQTHEPDAVLVAGVSARAMAESAARAGFRVTAVDGFGDLDLQRAAAHTIRATGPKGDGHFRALHAAGLVRGRPERVVAYLSGFENHPRAVARLAAGRALWGNSPAALARARDPVGVSRALRAAGIPAPRVRRRAPTASTPGGEPGEWLVKPRASGGGRGVRAWVRGTPLPPGALLQERIDGVPGAVVFAADGARAVVLGLSRQLIGEADFWAHGYMYCGSVLAPYGDPQFANDDALLERCERIATCLTAHVGLIGVNGIDFVACDGVPYVVEVNPRWSASMELSERAYGISMFGAHAAACSPGTLPAFDFRAARAEPGTEAVGKAIIYARRPVVLGDTRAWFADDTLADIPRPGSRIAPGRPVCTVFARGRDAIACRAALVRRAESLYQEIESRWRRRA